MGGHMPEDTLRKGKRSSCVFALFQVFYCLRSRLCRDHIFIVNEKGDGVFRQAPLGMLLVF